MEFKDKPKIYVDNNVMAFNDQNNWTMEKNGTIIRRECEPPYNIRHRINLDLFNETLMFKPKFRRCDKNCTCEHHKKKKKENCVFFLGY